MNGRSTLRTLVLWLSGLVLAFPLVFPLWWTLSSSLKRPFEVFSFPPSWIPDAPRWSNYAEVFRQGPFARQLFNSIYIATLVAIGVIILSSLAGYAFARIQFRGRNVLFVMLLLGLFLPTEATIIPLFQLFSRLGWVNTHLPLIVEPMLGPLLAFGIFVMRQSFLSLPDELEEAARLDGFGRPGIWWHVALPLVRPALATVGILAALNSWNRFLEPLLYVPKTDKFTVPIALTQYVTTEGGPVWEVQMAATVISIIPLALVFMAAQRYFVQGIASIGVKG